MVAWTQTESHAQEPPARERPSITFKSGVEVVTVTAAVRDRRGRVVRDLSRDDFQVLDTGAKRTIRDFHAGDAPISLAIVLDISGSMAVGGNMDRARQAVAFAVSMLNGEHDEAALFTFDAKLQEVVTFTKDVDVIRRVSLEGRPWGITSLYDAVAATAKAVAERANRHRAMLVITDGIDTGSRMSAPDVSGIASSIDVPVYLLTVVTPLDHPGGEYSVLSADGADARFVLADALLCLFDGRAQGINLCVDRADLFPDKSLRSASGRDRDAQRHHRCCEQFLTHGTLLQRYLFSLPLAPVRTRIRLAREPIDPCSGSESRAGATQDECPARR